MKFIILFVFVTTLICVASGHKLSNIHRSEDTIVRKLKPGSRPVATGRFRNSPTLASNGIKPRITGGAYAWGNMIPYQASLTVEFTDDMIGLCGGTLIGNEWVLSAAHCFSRDFKSVQIGLGGIDRNNPLYTTWADQIMMPTKWDPTTLDGDVVLLKFPWVNYNEWISPAHLPPKNARHLTFLNNKVTASGWGYVSDEGEDATSLKYATMTVVDNGVCARAFGFNEASVSVMLCVSTLQGHSTCSGDSGGPLVVENSRLLVGVISFVSAKGCTKGLPMGFTRVSNYSDWIERNTGLSWY